MCDDMCDVLYKVMLYCNVVQSFVVERHNNSVSIPALLRTYSFLTLSNRDTPIKLLKHFI